MKTTLGVVFLAVSCFAAKLPSSYVPPGGSAAPVRVQQTYVPPAPQAVAAAPVRVQQTYVPPAPQAVAAAPVRVQQTYVPPAPQAAAAAPVKQLKETYVRPIQSSSEIVFPPDGQPAPWHPDPRRRPDQPLVVSGASQPGSGYVLPAPQEPSAPRQTHVPPSQPAQPPKHTYVPPSY